MLPLAPVGTGLTAGQRRERSITADLAAAGLTEVLSFPFIGAADLDALGLDRGRQPAAGHRAGATRWTPTGR